MSHADLGAAATKQRRRRKGSGGQRANPGLLQERGEWSLREYERSRNMNQDIRSLNDEEILTVSGGCTHGSGDCPNGSGKGDGLRQLRQLEGAILDGLKGVGRALGIL
jgi:hypothetical protein